MQIYGDKGEDMRNRGWAERQMKRVVTAVATLAILGVLPGCNKSPTEPESSNQFGVVGGFQCLDGARIQQFQLLLDGAVIQDVSFSPATNPSESRSRISRAADSG
jgi:hypothetical protein